MIMQNYNSDNRRNVGWGVAVTAIYAVTVALLLYFGSVVYHPSVKTEAQAVEVEFVEPPEQLVEPPAVVVEHAPRHERLAAVDNSRQVSGKAEQTQTVNRQALFKMNNDGADEPVNGGNPYAAQGDKTTAKGTGGGLNAEGNEFLDRGLQGRGLAGALPRPDYPTNKSGTVVVQVRVDSTGNVTQADYEPKGSTTADAALVDAAIRAARRAKFTESKAHVQGGTITYTFKLR